jgi:succinyl-CoA synthetase alpha subunit
MSILINKESRVVVQGITGFQGRFDTMNCLAYGTQIVAGVTPGRGGEDVEGVPVYNTVHAAVDAQGADVAVIYVPGAAVRDAVFEAVDAGIKVLLATTENVPRHDAAAAVAATHKHDSWLVGFNTNGMITPGECRLGGIGGNRTDDIYVPGRIGVCSRSGGMSAELSITLKNAGYGVSTCISMGGDPITGRLMHEYAEHFEADPETDAIVVYGEPGSTNEQDLAQALAAGKINKPVVALVAGRFQELYPEGVSFGHVAAMIQSPHDSASAKRKVLEEAGALIAESLDDIPRLLAEKGVEKTRELD